MFTSSSDFYDIIYSFKDYEKESSDIIGVIQSEIPEPKSILDVGCGTAEHHKYLGKEFAVDGIDLNLRFIEIAKQKNPRGIYLVADMKNFRMNKKYDVILCLFSSIAYLENPEEITSALTCFHAHLNPGGIVIVEPWFTKENLSAPKVHMVTVDKEDIKICRMNRSRVKGDYSFLNFQYLVGTLENGVQHFEEEHRLRLSSEEEMIDAFKKAGFTVRFEEKGLVGRGMYYGRKKNI